MDEIKTGSLENPLVDTFPLTSTAPIASPKALGGFDYIPVKIMSHLALMNPPYWDWGHFRVLVAVLCFMA